jgi:hypothetical protein
MWRKLRGVSDGRAVVEVAINIDLLTVATGQWLLRELGEISEDPEEAVLAAAATGDLVLTERPRRAWWQRQLIAINWDDNSALWDYFWELARRGKADQPIDRTMFAEKVHEDFVIKQKSRLLKMHGFPSGLGDLIQKAGRGTQKLAVPAAHIRIFELITIERLQERTA